MNQFVPVLPDSAPFTSEQRAYLNGFFAGLFSRAPQPNLSAPAPEAKPLTPLTILFGSQTGNAETLSKRIAKEAGKRGFAPTIHDFAKYPISQLISEKAVLVITSTYGDGEPPDNAKAFCDFIKSDGVPKLAGMRFSLCALGDSNYPKFCAFGKSVDERLEKLGALRIHPRTDCDVDYEEAFIKWLHGALAVLAGADSNQLSVVSHQPDATARASEKLITDSLTTGYSKNNPFPGRLLTNRRLNAAGSGKDVRHFEVALGGSGLIYEVGDAPLPLN